MSCLPLGKSLIVSVLEISKETLFPMSAGTKASKVVLQRERELTPVLSTRYALSWQHAAIVTWLAISYLLISHMPVSLHSVWWHVNQGNWIVEQKVIPTTLPSSTYADGISYIPTTWLSDITMAMGVEAFGMEFVPTTMALLTTLSLGLWCWLYTRQSQTKTLNLLAMVLLTFGWSFGFSALRSQVFAGVLCPILLWLVWPRDEGHAKQRPQTVLAVCGLLMVWSNLDTSFFLGIAILASIAIDRFVRAWIQEGRGNRALRDKAFQQSLLVVEAASLATLASPRGWQTWLSVLQGNVQGPVWSNVGGENGLQMSTWIGFACGVLMAWTIVVWQFSSRPKDVRDVCLFVVVLVATALNPQNIYWLAPVALFLVARHGDGLPLPWLRAQTVVARQNTQVEHHPLLFGWTLLSGLVIWCAFAFSPVSAPVLNAKSRSLERILGKSDLIEIAKILKADSQGVIWAPAEWSDWLQFGAGDRELFVNSRLRHFPATVQRDYGRILLGDSEWENLTEQYNIETLVIDKRRQAPLVKKIARSRRWQLAWESDQAMVLCLKGA